MKKDQQVLSYAECDYGFCLKEGDYVRIIGSEEIQYLVEIHDGRYGRRYAIDVKTKPYTFGASDSKHYWTREWFFASELTLTGVYVRRKKIIGFLNDSPLEQTSSFYCDHDGNTINCLFMR